MPMVLALPEASDAEASDVRPTAAPAAASSEISSVAMPTATSQPKKSAPHEKPPNSSRWRASTSRRSGAGAARRVSSTATAPSSPEPLVNFDNVGPPEGLEGNSPQAPCARQSNNL